MASVNRRSSYYYDTESGFYYLQYRYYDPQIGRFINADSYASTGQGFLGYNMFAYCNNNPVTSVDYSGSLPLYLDYGWENPLQKKDDDEQVSIPGTISVGIAIFGSPEFWEYGTQFGFSSDMNGNTEFQITGESGLTTGSGFAAMIYVMVTNAPDVSNLQGFGTAVGGVVPAPPVAIGIDYNIIPDPANETVYTGITLAMGSGTAEGHVMLGNTWGSKSSFNLLTVMNNVYNSLAFGMN